MSEYLEETDNILSQVFYEFAIFLFLAQTKSSNKYIHNVMLESKRIHARVLADFFSSTKRRETDLIYSELIDSSHSFLIDFPDHIRKFINKSTAHLTWERGTLDITDEESIRVVSSIVSLIRDFVKQVDEGRLKDQFKPLLEDDAFRELKNVVNKKLLSFYFINMDTQTQYTT